MALCVNESDTRGSERFETVRPIEVEGSPGLTRNISDNGICFETDFAPPLGATINITFEFSVDGARHLSHYRAEVVRIETGPRIVVGARLSPPFFSRPRT